jgi:hypothetical protein
MLHILPGTIESRRTKVTLSHSTVLDRIVFNIRREPSRLLQTACYAVHFARVFWRRARRDKYIDRRHM